MQFFGHFIVALNFGGGLPSFRLEHIIERMLYLFKR